MTMRINEYQHRNGLIKSIGLFLFDLISSFFIPNKQIEVDNYTAKILIIRNDKIGDVVQNTHIFKEIKTKYPRSKITFLVSNIGYEVVKEDRFINNYIVYNQVFRGKNKLKNYLNVIKKIRKEKFDVGIDLRASLTNIIFLLWMGNIKKTISYYNIGGGKGFLTNPIKFVYGKHTIDFDRELVEKGMDFEFVNKYPKLQYSVKDFIELNELITRYNLNVKDYICICPIASSLDRQWDLNKWERLIIKLSENNKIFLLGTNEKKEILEVFKARGLSNNINLLIDKNLRVLSLFLSKAKVVITNDGGIMHLSWTSGVKTIALWGSADKTMDKPLLNSVVLDKDKTRWKEVVELI